MRQLVFIHGRSQEERDAVELKAEWVAAWQAGLALNNLALPIADADIRFPYYGQTLYDLTSGVPADQAADIIVRGDDAGDREKTFIRSMLLEIQKANGVTDEQVQELAGDRVVERGVLNWGWVQKALRALDQHVPGASGQSVAIATRDVYLYLNNPGFRNVIDAGVRNAFTPGVETTVVGHSLGSIVAYNLLKRDRVAQGWNVPLFVTVGAPLAVRVVKESLAPIGFPPCAGSWFNAKDAHDVVALYPLDSAHFDVDPPIENKTDVNNTTSNRHGISGYLSDPVVAKRIYDALTATTPVTTPPPIP